jgi:hypothetical protein
MKNDNEIGGCYGSALCAACANGKSEVVTTLLNMGASPTILSK